MLLLLITKGMRIKPMSDHLTLVIETHKKDEKMRDAGMMLKKRDSPTLLVINHMEVLNTHESSQVWWYRSVVSVFKKLRHWAFEVS